MRKWLLFISAVLVFVLVLFAGAAVVYWEHTPAGSPATEPSETQQTVDTTPTETTAQVPVETTTVPVTTEPTTQPTTVEPTQATTEGTIPTTENIIADTTAPTTEPTETAAPYGLLSKKAFVYDMSTGAILYNYGDIREKVYPASLTKLFTAYVALQHLEPETLLTAGDEQDLLDPDSSIAYIYKGQTVTASMCIQGLLMQSGNDAAYILAVGAGRAIANDETLGYMEAIQVFMDEVNRIARKAGLYNTHFTTPDGIHDEDHYTTMEDLIIISKLAMENDIIREYCAMAKKFVVYASGESATWHNSNLLLQEGSEYYIPEACGLKTGSTNAAGNCLLSTFRQGDSYLLIGTFGAPDYYDRYVDTIALYEEFGS